MDRWVEIQRDTTGHETVGRCMQCRGCTTNVHEWRKVQADYVARVTREAKEYLASDAQLPDPVPVNASFGCPSLVREPVRGEEIDRTKIRVRTKPVTIEVSPRYAMSSIVTEGAALAALRRV